MADDEPSIIIDRDGNVSAGPGADEDTARGIKEIDMDDVRDGGSSSGGGGGSSDSRSAEDFDPDDYPFARSVSDLGEIRRENYGFTDQERRRVERGEDPVPDGGEGFAVFDPEEGEVLGSGDTREEAATAAVRTQTQRGSPRFNQGLPFNVSDSEVERQQIRELENREEFIENREQELGETIENLPDADRLNIEGTELESEFDTDIVSRDQLRNFFQQQRRELETTREQVSNQRENVRFELSQVERPERTRRQSFDPSPDPEEPRTGIGTGTSLEPEFITDNSLDTMSPSGTIIDAGISEEFVRSNPELRPDAESQARTALPFTQQGLRFGLGTVTDRAGLTTDLREDAIESEIESLQDPDRDFGVTDILNSPVGLATTAVGGGAALQSARTATPRAAAAAERGLAGATGAIVGFRGAEATEQAREGETEEAVETAGLTAIDLGIVGGGFSAGSRALRPRVGDTSVSDVNIRLDETSADTLVGTGTAQSQTNVEIPRIFTGRDVETLQGDSDFLVQQTDQGVTAAGGIRQEQLLDDPSQQDFFSTARTRFQDEDQIITRDRLETEEDVLFGATRSPREEPEFVDRVGVEEDGLATMREGEFEVREFDTFSRFDSRPDELMGTTRTTVRRDTSSSTGSRSGEGAAVGGGRQSGEVIQDSGLEQAGVSGGQLEDAFSRQVDLDQLQVDSVDAAAMSGGAAASGRESTAELDAFEREEQQIQQQEENVMAVQNSPLTSLDDFTRQPVSDRLTRETSQEQRQETFESQGFASQEPRTGIQEPPQGLETIRDTVTPLSRGTTQQGLQEENTGLFEEQTVQQETPQDIRPVESNIVGLTRRETPVFRQETPTLQENPLLERTPSRQTSTTRQVTPPTQPPITPPRPSTSTGRPGIPSSGIGGEIETGVFGSDPGAPSEGGFSPDLTGSLFGGGVTDGPVTGLERRNPEEEEDELFGDPNLF